MKWIFYVLVFIYMFYRTVYGLKAIHKEVQGLTIEPISYGPEKNYFEAGTRKSITCKGANKNQKVEWLDPSGKVVPRLATNRVFTQEHFVSTFRSRVPAMVLIITKTSVDDTGVWQCRSGELKQNASLCIMEPSEFLETQTEVSVDRGRSITLSCQAKGEPEPRLVWYRHDNIISDDNPSKYQIMTKYNSQGFEGLLTITSLEGEDSGVYNCFAIQESSYVDGCSASVSMNITLLVNYAPTFVDGNDTTLVPVQENQSTKLECFAEGYPTPTYRWFKEVGDILSEFPAKDIESTENGEKAILSVTADESSFGQRYKCRATNKYGSAEKSFAIIKLEKPTGPTEIITGDPNYDGLNFIAKWDGDLYFPVEEFQIQYMESKLLLRKKVGKPREVDWKRSEEVMMKTDEFDVMGSEGSGIFIKLADLKEETEYWVRFKAVNEAGESAWSEPILASTIAKPEEDVEVSEEVEESDEPTTAARVSNGTFYGVFFAGGIIVVILGATFIIRMV